MFGWFGLWTLLRGRFLDCDFGYCLCFRVYGLGLGVGVVVAGAASASCGCLLTFRGLFIVA